MISPVQAWAAHLIEGRNGAGHPGGSSGNSAVTSGAPVGAGGGTNIASRNGRGVTTGVPPTRKGRSAGVGNCRNQCCPNCNNGTPRYWTLKIPAATPGLYLATFPMEHAPQEYFGFGCAWEWNGSTLAFVCGGHYLTRVHMFIYSHGPIQVTLTGPDGVLGYYVLNGIPTSISCTATKTLTWVTGNLGCEPLYSNEAELVPSDEQYTPCCGECASAGSGSGTQSCSNGCCSLMDSTNEYDVDLGAGGWTNDRCDFCTSVLGVFTVTRVSDCSWIYSDADVCVCTNSASLTPDFTITLTRSRIGTTCYWIAHVRLYTCATSSSEGAGGEYATYYGVSEATSVSCNLASPVTLTKTNESDTTTATECNGSLPNTITIQSV